ncbi:MAG: hypothetical protein ACUVS2_03340 [Candidatus Flexifilum sp.]|jgi:hypothetical protein
MPPIWTPPATWNAGDIVTAAQLNTHLRDNLLFLKTRTETPFNAVSRVIAANLSTTSTVFVDVNAGLYATLTTSGAPALITLSGTWKNSTAGAEIYMDIMIDGLRIGDPTYGIFMMQSHGDRYQSFSWSTIRPLGAAVHAFMPQWRVSAGAASVILTTSFYVLELV